MKGRLPGRLSQPAPRNALRLAEDIGASWPCRRGALRVQGWCSTSYTTRTALQPQDFSSREYRAKVRNRIPD